MDDLLLHRHSQRKELSFRSRSPQHCNYLSRTKSIQYLPLSSSTWVSILPSSSRHQAGSSSACTKLLHNLSSTPFCPNNKLPLPPPPGKLAHSPSSRPTSSVHLPRRPVLLLLAIEDIPDVAAADRTGALIPVDDLSHQLEQGNQPSEPPLETGLVVHMHTCHAGAGRQPHLRRSS